MSKNQPAPVSLRLPGDLRDQVDAARGETPRNAWIVAAIEAALAPTAPPPTAPPAPPPGYRPKATEPDAEPVQTAPDLRGRTGPAAVEYKVEHRQVASVWQWRQPGATKPRNAASATAVRDDARAAIKAAGEYRPFIVRLIPWSQDA